MDIKDFATLTVSYNDEKLIGGMLKGVEDLHNLVIISKPWRGEHIKFDKSGDIAKKMDAEVIFKDFTNERDERNWGLEYLEKEGFKYIFIVDTDEYYTKNDIYKIIKYISITKADSYFARNVKVYWKTWKYYFQYKGATMCIKSNHRIVGKRSIDRNFKNISLLNNVILYHFSYCGMEEDMRIKSKTRNYTILNDEWINKYWMDWKFNDNSFKEILKTKDIPEEILGRYIKSINLLY